jgi:hypothetical protein
MNKLFAYSCAILLLLCGQAIAQQPKPCVTAQGYQIPYIADYTLNNVGIATKDANGYPVILMNPNVLQNFPPLAQEFWFAHECAHHVLLPYQNNETNADCYAVRALRYLRLLQNPNAVQQFFSSILGLQGNPWSGHLPGPQRVQAMRICLNGG